MIYLYISFKYLAIPKLFFIFLFFCTFPNRYIAFFWIFCFLNFYSLLFVNIFITFFVIFLNQIYQIHSIISANKNILYSKYVTVDFVELNRKTNTNSKFIFIFYSLPCRTLFLSNICINKSLYNVCNTFQQGINLLKIQNTIIF